MTEPKNKNLLAQSKYEMVFSRLPHVKFFLQSFTFPGLNTGSIEFNTAFSNVPLPGDSIQYEDLSCNVLLDEDMFVYSEVHDWMIANNKRDNSEQYNRESEVDTASIYINTNNNTKNIKVDFTGIFPVDLGSFEPTFSESDDYEPVVLSIMFKFQKLDIIRSTTF